MELFRLLGTIAIESDAAIKDIQATANEAKSAESKMSSTFKSIGQKSVDLGKKMAAASAVATGALVGIVKSSANVAAEVSAYEQIMGDYADTASKKLAGVADAVGMSDTRLTPYMTSMTAKFQGLGLGIEQSTDLAASGLTIAADAAAFWDKSLEDSMSALNSFVNGNYEGGESIGLFANEATLARYAAEELGLEWQNLTEAEKQMTRLSFAEEMQRNSQVTGQAAKESGQYANVMAELGESIRQLGASLGETLLPVVTKVVQWLTNVTEKLAGMNDGTKFVVVAVTALVAISSPLLMAFGMMMTGVSALIPLFGKLTAATAATTTSTATLNATMAVNPINIVIVAITALVAAFIYLWNNCEGFREFWINLWKNIKAKVAEAKEQIVTTFNNLKSSVSNIFNSIKSVATTVFKAISLAMTNPLKAASLAVKALIDKIKSYFNFSWSLPKLKLPHIDITGKFKLDPPSTPKFSIKWYKKAMDNAMLLNSPTIFGYGNGSFLGGGEAGQEVVAGSETLMNMVRTAVSSQNTELVAILQGILSAIKDMDSRMYRNIEAALDNRKIQWNDRELGRLVSKYA